ncbi:unnamed protein product, partial [Prorocentrum cordatum]
SGARPERQSAIHGRFELSAHTENEEEEEEEEEEERERDRDSHGGHRGAPWPHRSARHPGPGPACPAAQTGEAAREGEGCEAAGRARTRRGRAAREHGTEAAPATPRPQRPGHRRGPAPRAPAGAGCRQVPASAPWQWPPPCRRRRRQGTKTPSDKEKIMRGGGGRGEGGGTPKVTTYAPRVNRGPPKSAPTGGGRPGEVRGRQRWPKVQKPRGARAPGLGAGGLRGLAGGVRLHPGGPPR